MKHQYFGDVNDYLKYGLLRALTDASGLRVGVAWMRTPDDDRPDGSRTAYWKDDAWSVYDPPLFRQLARLASQPSARNLELFRRWELVPGAHDYDAPLPEPEDERATWLLAARAALAACPLVFFDPDNGFEVDSVPHGRRGSSKYLYWSEAEATWAAGHSLLVYQHFPRENRDAFAAALYEQATRRLADAHVTLLRSPHALFLLAARPAHAEALARGVDSVLDRWSGRFERVALQAATAEVKRPGDRAADLAAVCDALGEGGPVAAARALAERYPLDALARTRRSYSELDALQVWVRDGFVDRYDGTRLVFPGMLRLLSIVLPAEFPYHPNGKVDSTHPAYWDLCPTLDPVVPVARGGLDIPENWVTTSQRNNSAKAHWTLAELGWSLRAGGTLANWDGLTGRFRAELARHPELRRNGLLGKWADLLDRALPER